MALTKSKKDDVVTEVAGLLATSKLTVVAKYEGTTVKAMQELRRSAKENGTVVKVIKNRLVIKALQSSETFKDAPTADLTNMLVYAFNSEDEAAPAQALATFAKAHPTIEFVGGFVTSGQFIGSDDIKALAALPSKEQLRGMLVGTLAAPLSGFVTVMAGNVRGVLNVLNARAETLDSAS
jgi:large subunit ribosomal protein L10